MTARISLTLRQFQEVEHLHPTLWEVLEDCIQHWPGEQMEVTCIYRNREEEKAAGGKSGVHVTEPHRAADLRIKNLGEGFKKKALALAETINSLWIYDDINDEKRKNLNVAYAKPHGTGPHVHIQVHSRTVRRPLF